MREELVEPWCRALEGGEYKQATGRLQRRNWMDESGDALGKLDSYCCLGVLCLVAKKMNPEIKLINEFDKTWQPEQTLNGGTLADQPDVLAWSGIRMEELPTTMLSEEARQYLMDELQGGMGKIIPEVGAVRVPESLMDANDLGVPFSVIAKVIRKYWREL